MNEFEEYVDATKTIPLNGKELKIAVKTKDAGRFFLALKGLDENNEEQVDKISDLAVKFLKAGNPEIEVKEINQSVMYNFPEVIKELSIAFGFAKREDFAIADKKKAEDKQAE